MDNPKISVIVPVYNVERFIRKSVDSVLAQTFHNLEIILVDDGSADRSPEICDEYAKSERRIKVIHKENGGLSEARNSGIATARGEYLMFLDSDDYWDDCYALQDIANMLAKEDADLIVFGLKKFNLIDGNTVIRDIQSVNIENYSKTDVLTRLISNNEYKSSACTKVIKRNMIVQKSIYFHKGFVSEDIEWSVRIALHSDVIKIYNNSFLVYVNQRDGSITSSINSKSCNDYITLLQKSIEYINQYEKRSQDKYLYFCYWAYQYSILLGLTARLPNNHDYNHLINKIRQYQWILNYDLDKKVKYVNKLYRVFGFNVTVNILGLYINYAYRTKVSS